MAQHQDEFEQEMADAEAEAYAEYLAEMAAERYYEERALLGGMFGYHPADDWD